ncbi:MAG: DNA-3-methyladenine glycosylase 2 family protein [Clostridia bacterium]|nr:DNA-3-methyladenine glycosylase 2 family protein [Clostridia bacterium]
MFKLSDYKTEYTCQNGDVILNNIDCFELADTLDCGQAFRFNGEGNVWQGVALDRPVALEKSGNDIILHDMDEKEFLDKFYRYFTLDIDYPALIKEFCKDETLKKATDFARGIRMLRQDKWETVCSFIISQNNNIPRIKGIIDRLCQGFGKPLGGGLYSFPTAQDISCLTVEDLSPLRAGFRAKYIIDAAKKIADGTVDTALLETASLDEARASLMQINGVGPKVAECVLLFSCSRFDAFPLDVWIKRVMAILYPDGLPDCALEYKGIAQQYLFHYARMNKLKGDE